MPTAIFQLRADHELLQEIKEREWREGFEAMGRDPDTNAEYLLPAAREVVFGDVTVQPEEALRSSGSPS